jgi:lantibiotic modifying enzyme
MSIIREIWEERVTKEYIKKPEDKITCQVMEDLKSRADRGVKKYGTTLESNNKDDFMNHAYEEALDLAQYLKKEMSIIPILQQIIKQNPNDVDLGATIRFLYGK